MVMPSAISSSASGASAMCWRPAAGRVAAAELLTGSEGGACERWRAGVGNGAHSLAQPAVHAGGGEVYGMSGCAATGEVFVAVESGFVHRLGV